MARDYPFMPRLLKRDEAAHYSGVSPNTFDAMVAKGIFPKPSLEYGARVVRWDRARIDEAIDQLSESDHQLDGWDDL